MDVQSEAQSVLSGLNGWNEPARKVSEAELPSVLHQDGTGCDCKGCDNS